jgi:hypothetical protein
MVSGAIAHQNSSCNGGTQSGSRRHYLLTAETVWQAVKVRFRPDGVIGQLAGDTPFLAVLRAKNDPAGSGSCPHAYDHRPSPFGWPFSSRNPMSCSNAAK